MGYLLDTNVVSELRMIVPGKAHPNVRNWFKAIDSAEVFISVITLQELEIGVKLVEFKDATQGGILRAWLDTHVKPTFNQKILSINEDVAIKSASYYIPDAKPTRDALIAATAEVFKLTIVTRNVSDFAYSNAKIINPWL